MANYFRNENFEILKSKNLHNLITFINCSYVKVPFNFIIIIIIFRIFLFIFNSLFLDFGNF